MTATLPAAPPGDEVEDLVRRIRPALARIARRRAECLAEAARGGPGNAHVELHIEFHRGDVAGTRTILSVADRPA